MSVPAFVVAVQARDAAAARAALAPTFLGKANGKPLDADAQVRLLESFWAGFPDGQFVMEAVGGSGRYVITWTFQGTHGGLYLGVPPTGKPVAFSGFITTVADGTGVTSLDWKWDTKVFTKAVLGPDDVGSLEVKDHFRADPSRRWSHGPPGGPRRKKGKGGPGAGPGRAPKPAAAPTPPRGPPVGPDGQPLPPREPRPLRPVLGPDGQPVLGPDGQPLMQAGKRRRRRGGRGPKPGPDGAAAAPATTADAPMAHAAPVPSASAAEPSADAKPAET